MAICKPKQSGNKFNMKPRDDNCIPIHYKPCGDTAVDSVDEPRKAIIIRNFYVHVSYKVWFLSYA